ncbi:hypothetical protein D3C78_1473350 [compost metagenome]
MALAGALQRFEPDFTRVGEVPAGQQKIVASRFTVAFQTKRGVGNNYAIQHFAQRHHGRGIGRDRTAQRSQDLGDQFRTRIFTTRIVNQLAQRFDFAFSEPLEH